MPGKIILKEWEECNECGSTELASRLTMEKLGVKLDKNQFTSVRTFIRPLSQSNVVGVPCKVLQVHYDICMDCGRERITRLEIEDKKLSVDELQIMQLMQNIS